MSSGLVIVWKPLRLPQLHCQPFCLPRRSLHFRGRLHSICMLMGSCCAQNSEEAVLLPLAGRLKLKTKPE
jgi:hypothetical protein